MTGQAVRLSGVTKRFGEVLALGGVDFEVQAGRVFGFLGPNGAGKSTAIGILTGFIKADTGTAQVFGLDAWRDSVAVKRRVGYLPDNIAFPPGLTGQAFLDHVARLHGIKGSPPRQRELLERLELPHSALRRKVRGYSSGMAKKLALVQAMQHNPDLLIMDEPTEALDPLMRQAMFGLFRELEAEGVTIFMSSHILADVEEVCRDVALIRHGRIVRSGTVDDLRAEHARTMTVTFRDGAPEPLDLPGTEVVSRDGSTVRLVVTGDVNDVVRALANHDLEDVVYERLSLDELFLGFYRDQPEASRA